MNLPAAPATSPSTIQPGLPAAWLMHGTPGSGWVRAQYLAWDKRPRLVMPGTASFLLQLKGLPWAMRPLYFGGDARAAGPLERLPCINFMADADILAVSLRQAAMVARQMRTPCFNHPAAVLASGRDAVSRVLKDVPGLQVPTTVKVRADREAQLLQAMEDAGIEYPVIVRMAGDQGGVSTVRVDGPDGWEALNALPWGGRDVYLTQYVDFSDDDGCFRKVRLAVVGERVLIKHHYTSSEWMIHFRARGAKSDIEEPPFLANFETDTLPKIQAAVLEMARRLGLDYFGIDASIRPDGRLLVFEANATMNMLDNHSHKGTLWLEPTAKISDALRALISRPQTWRAAGPRGTAA